MSKPEVLPCPFCGAEPLMREIEPHTHSGPLKALGIPDYPGSHVIECGCGAGMIADAKQAVMDMWNRRETYTYQEARIAELVLSLRTVVGMLHHKATTPLERESIRIAEAALAQQGKDGE